MKIVLDLNPDCERLLPRVERVFLFDDDHTRLLFWQILTPKLKRVVGLKSLAKKMCAQMSFYEMPDGKVCAVAYPSSVKVDWDVFKKEMHKIFAHVEEQQFDEDPFMFQIFCEQHGFRKQYTVNQNDRRYKN